MGLGTGSEVKRREEVELASWISMWFWEVGSKRSGFQVTCRIGQLGDFGGSWYW